MKQLFPGYYKKNELEIKKIWENGVIIFDTNVLLNLYRYSDSTRDTILDLVSKFSEQIYLPHQAALEYNRNRYEVIAEQEKAYNEFLGKISQIQKDLQSTNKPPFLSSKVDKDLNSVFEHVSSEVQDSIKKYCEYLKDDPIYNRISELFSERITVPFSIEKLNEIYKEGEERYKLKIPPGFEDEKTKEGVRKFGDLILWKQIIEKAKELNKDIILITDDSKIDWWWKIKDGRNMGPRQELVEEIKTEANVDFHMYSSERFLSYGQSFLKEQINQQALEEIQAMKKAEMEEMRRIKRFKERNFMEKEATTKEEISFLRNKIEDLNKKIFNLNKHSESLFKETIENPEIQEYIHSLSIHEAELEEEKSALIHKLESLQKTLLNFRDRDSDINFNSEKKRIWKYLSEENDKFRI
ncbi:PIN domain-containing protein [Flavobacterium facile]|uniref:PIN domain-containing protein n=1 Tax=Flavobacterium facile TaxID=2893174 RepID=UPI002E79A51F|nr:PIN domain-containing protein [Flavobacterium sp. T-12]